MGFLLDCFKKQKSKILKKDNTECIEIELEDKEKETKLIKFSNNNNYLANIYESQIGFYNAGGSCYMASIIQILIHLKNFMEVFSKKKETKNNYLSELFKDLIDKIGTAKKSIEISDFSNSYNKINHKFRGDTGNNPMTFFIEFIKQLESENGDILKLFSGKNLVQFHGMDDMDYEEDFIFYMITLDKIYINIDKAMNKEKEMEDDKNIKITEKIILKPEIFVINLEIDDIDYDFEEIIKIDNIIYELKAINEYNNYHSTV